MRPQFSIAPAAKSGIATRSSFGRAYETPNSFSYSGKTFVATSRATLRLLALHTNQSDLKRLRPNQVKSHREQKSNNHFSGQLLQCFVRQTYETDFILLFVGVMIWARDGLLKEGDLSGMLYMLTGLWGPTPLGLGTILLTPVRFPTMKATR